MTSPLPWVPVIDSYCSKPYYPKQFKDAIKENNNRKVALFANSFSQYIHFQIPVLMGLTKDEGMILSAPFFHGPKRWDILKNDWKTWAPAIFFGRERDNISTKDEECAKKIAKFYFGQEDLHNLEQSTETISTITKVKDIF